MSSYAKTLLLGNVGQEPFISEEGKTPFASLSLAVNRPGKDKEGNDYPAQWFDVVCFSGLATVVKDYVKKGDPIFIEARPENHQYKDKEGVEHKTIRFVANEIRLLGSRNS